MPTVRVVTGNTPREPPEPNAEGGHRRNGGGGGGSILGIRELRHQKSIRRQLHRWRSSRWLSKQDINLDESQSPRPRTLCQRAVCLLVLLILLISAVFALVMAVDGIRMLPCMKPHNKCFEVKHFTLGDLCDFKKLPYHFAADVHLPDAIASTIHIHSTDLKMYLAGSDEVLVTTRGSKGDALTSMALHGGTSTIGFQSFLDVK